MAHNTRIPPVIYMAVDKLLNKKNNIPIENINPINAANRFGGANIGLGLSFNAVDKLFAIIASKEGSLIPALIAKSNTRKNASNFQPVINITIVIITTCAATKRILFSSI